MKRVALAPPSGTYVAFLRGINVGGRSIIKMAELRTVFESLGYLNVKTVLASGNILFKATNGDVAALTRAIADEFERLYGREITVVVRPVDELRALAAREPFRGVDAAAGARPIVTFIVDSTNGSDTQALPDHEGFRILSVSDGVICSVSYDRYGTGTAESMGLIEKAFGHKVTTRTWDTIKRIIKAADQA